MFEQWLIVGGNLARTRLRRFEQRVSTTQSAFVGPQRRPVYRPDLRSNKIEVSPPWLRAAAREIDIGVGKRDDASDPQIFPGFTLVDSIESNLPAQRGVTKVEPVAFVVACDSKRFCTEFQQWRQSRAPLRLQAEKHAGRLENRRFSLPVCADNEVETTREFRCERFKTTKVFQLQLTKHEGLYSVQAGFFI